MGLTESPQSSSSWAWWLKALVSVADGASSGWPLSSDPGPVRSRGPCWVAASSQAECWKKSQGAPALPLKTQLFPIHGSVMVARRSRGASSLLQSALH